MGRCRRVSAFSIAERYLSVMKEDLSELEEKIEYRFSDRRYLETALTHSSYANERTINRCDNYERQEFLGDAVLELISSEHLFALHPEMPEGDLTKLRAAMVCEPTLAARARNIGLDEYMRLGRGEEATGGRQRDSIISDICEALIGGIYLDGGIENARRFILDHILTEEVPDPEVVDAKSELQVRVQAVGKTVTYEVVGESGPDHAKVFDVNCIISGHIAGSGQGKTKKSAQQAAARDALRSVYVS